ncbi:hypothetical protein PQG02_18860 [Nostoc sp. UHCC 0926]|nr:hypothetical protein PQG02_18860 [Nostoc sp. UHCC 0926]
MLNSAFISIKLLRTFEELKTPIGSILGTTIAQCLHRFKATGY